MRDGDAADPCRARCCRHDSGQDPHRRALSCAIGAEEANDFAAVDGEAYVLNRSDSPELSGKIFNAYAGNGLHLYWYVAAELGKLLV